MNKNQNDENKKAKNIPKQKVATREAIIKNKQIRKGRRWFGASPNLGTILLETAAIIKEIKRKAMTPPIAPLKIPPPTIIIALIIMR